MSVSYSEIAEGQNLPALEVGPITRTQLALYAGASGDHNPMHIDLDFARKYGSEDVFAHGMLSMAYLGRVVTSWVSLEQVREYRVRFKAITPVNAKVKCTGQIVEKYDADGEQCAKVALQAELEDGTVTLTGEAVVVFG